MNSSLLLPSLSVEIAYLALAGALLFVHLVVQAVLLTRQFGSEYNAGARDEQRQVTGLAGRAERALRNYVETFPLFAALILAVTIVGKADGWTGFGAALYFWARVAYLPLYLAGVPYVRSAVWRSGPWVSSSSCGSSPSRNSHVSTRYNHVCQL